MNRLRTLALAFAVTLAAAQVAPAQEKTGGDQPPPQTKKGAGKAQGTYRYVSGNETLTHGDEVTITRKNNEGKVKGVFVWMDPKADRVYVRPLRGEVPVGIPAGDIDKVERVAPAGNVPDKGGVKFAVGPDGMALPNYEIHTLEIYNGMNKTVAYHGSSLSRPERERLSDMEKAADEVAQKRGQLQSINQAIQNVSAAATDSGASVGPAFNPGYVGPYPTFPYVPAYQPYLSPFAFYSTVFSPFSYYDNYLLYPPYAGVPYGPGYWQGYYGLGYGPAGGSTTVVLQNSGSNGSALPGLMKSLAEAQTALAAAQRNYTTVSNRAIYDSNGRIVAVRLEQ